MVQRSERFSERIVFYVTPTTKGRFDAAVASSDLEPAGWLRHALEEALAKFENQGLAASAGDENGSATLASQLAAAEARLESQEEVVALLRERLGMADAQNIELNRRLEESHSAVERVTLALPARVEDTEDTRRNWQFWKRLGQGRK